MSTNFAFADPTPKELEDHDRELGDAFGGPDEFTGITFAARVHNLLLTMQAAGTSFPMLEDHQNGIKRRISPGFRLEFRGGYLVVDQPLRKAWTDFLARNGEHYLYDAEELAALRERPLEELLREHPLLNSSNPDGFREIAQVIPPAAAALEEILDAALRGDEDALERMYDAELEGFKREQVLEATQKALEALHQRATGTDALGAAASVLPEVKDPEPQLTPEQIAEEVEMGVRGPQAPVSAESLVQEQREGGQG